MIYLDSSATTPMDPRVLAAMEPYFREEYGNPSSKYYPLALHAQEAVEEAREQVALLVGAKPEEILFTCGATESTNTILKGVSDYRKLYEKRGSHIVTTKAEHHATLNTCKFLNGELYSNDDATFTLGGGRPKVDRGFEVTFLDVNQYGQLEPETLEGALRPTTTIASILWGNNELGSLNDIRALGELLQARGVFFHADGTQVLGKLPVDVSGLPVDAMSFSAHKLRGPKGVGALYVRTDEFGLMPPFSALMHGGSQENGTRGGTLCVPNIVGFGAAARLVRGELAAQLAAEQARDRAIMALIRTMPELELLGDPTHRLPGIFSVVVHAPLFHNELFLRAVGQEFAASTGSACAAGEPSHVLQAIGRGDQTGRVLRISLGPDGTVEEVKALLERLKQEL